MLLLAAEHSAPGSLEECHAVIPMTMDCQQKGLMLNVGAVITPNWVAQRKSGQSCSSIVSQ